MTALAVDVLFLLAALPVAVAALYLLALAALSGRRAPPPRREPRLRFDVIVPAHDEEAGIADTVRSLSAIDYPAPLRRIVVVADNCTDGTAARAREAGAEVLVRVDPERRGKGYALQLAFERSIAAGADAVVVVDADTVASPELLHAFAARLEAGARAVQARYGVRNPNASWRTQLMAVALALVNDVRSLGRDRIGCSVGLKGNGMCFSTALLREVPHTAFSIVEDLEYGLRLGRAGVAVVYAPEAAVLGEMVAGAEASRSQRLRWEGGRKRITREQGWPLLRHGLAQGDRICIDLALDLLVPPLATVGAAALAGTLAAAAASWALGVGLVATWVWGLCLVALVLYVARGWWVSRTGLAGLAGLVHAPIYLIWKLGLALRRSGTDAWVRTTRER